MSEDSSSEYEEFNENTEFEKHLEGEGLEYEEVEDEISSEEVDRVLESLTTLLETVESATVQEYLEEAYNQIFSLIYEEDDESESEVEVEGEIENFDSKQEEDLDDDDQLEEEAA